MDAGHNGSFVNRFAFDNGCQRRLCRNWRGGRDCGSRFSRSLDGRHRFLVRHWLFRLHRWLRLGLWPNRLGGGSIILDRRRFLDRHFPLKGLWRRQCVQASQQCRARAHGGSVQE